MTDRSVDSGVGSDVAMMDFMDDDHQMTSLKDAKSPDKGQLKVKGQQPGHAEPEPQSKTDKFAENHFVSEEVKSTKEKSPKDKTKKSKRSKTKAALKQPPPDILAAEIKASINASLKSPSDVPDDLNMPFLPGFEPFPEEEPRSKPEKHRSSKSKKKSKKDKEKDKEDKIHVPSDKELEKRTVTNDSVRAVEMLPDSITFSENELSDVLDQVESLGQSLSSDDADKSHTLMDSVLQTPKIVPMTPTVVKRPKRKKRDHSASDVPPSKKKRLSNVPGDVTKSTDILEKAMEGIGPLDMDYNEGDAQGDGDKMTIDLSAHSESDHNLDSPPFSISKSPTKAAASPGSPKKKTNTTAKSSSLVKDIDSDLDGVMEENTAVPNFGYSPVKPTDDRISRDNLDEQDKNKKRSESQERKEDNSNTNNQELDSLSSPNKKDSCAATSVKETSSFYGEMETELSINTETNSRSEKQASSLSPVSMSKTSFLDLPPMTPRTVDHLAKSLGCDPVMTPFDGDSLANMDNDDYPWLNTPQLGPPTPAQARHTNIASLARFDARPVATPKHPPSKSDSSKSSTTNQTSTAQSNKSNAPEASNKVSNSSRAESEKKDKPSSENKTQEKTPIISKEESVNNNVSPVVNSTSSPQKSQPALTIPPFQNNVDKPANDVVSSSFSPPSQHHNASTNQVTSLPSSVPLSMNSHSQPVNSSVEKNSQLVVPGSRIPDDRQQSSSTQLSASPVGSVNSLKPPGSNSSSTSTSPMKPQSSNKQIQPPPSQQQPQQQQQQQSSGAVYSSSNRRSPAASGSFSFQLPRQSWCNF